MGRAAAATRLEALARRVAYAAEGGPPTDDPDALAAGAMQVIYARLRALAAEIADSFMTGASEVPAAERAYADAVARAELAADLIGRLRTLREAGGAPAPAAPEAPSDVAGAAAEKARRVGASLLAGTLADVLRRYARGAPMATPQVRALLDRYTFGRAFTLARTASQVTTDVARGIIVTAAKEGAPVRTAAALVQRLEEGFTRPYAETVVRTNLQNAFSTGRWRAATDPAVAPAVAGFLYMATHDSNVRPNHLAADGLFLPTAHPAWDGLTPPCGFSCRCALRLVMQAEMDARGLRYSAGVPAGAHADSADFGRRPAL